MMFYQDNILRSVVDCVKQLRFPYEVTFCDRRTSLQCRSDLLLVGATRAPVPSYEYTT